MTVFQYHPSYTTDFIKWRLTFEGGQAFIERYLQQYSVRESPADFVKRKSVTYCPSYSKEGIIEIKNGIYQRLAEISRVGGSDTYRASINGADGGVDLAHSTMTSFMGTKVLPELLVMGQVGVYLDMPNFSPGSTLASGLVHPYVYVYQAENIMNWCTDFEGNYTQVLLLEYAYESDAYGLPTSIQQRYRHCIRNPMGGVDVTIYRDNPDYQPGRKDVSPYLSLGTTHLDLDYIPFYRGDIGDSLLKDIADYQIALLNMESSDIDYALRSNFPFYIEQYDPRTRDLYRNPGPTYNEIPGTTIVESPNTDGSSEEVRVGANKGRRYAKDLDAPAFIHPSSEPLQASMEKQAQMRQSIRELLNLSLTNISARATDQSREYERQGTLESGLAAIGFCLQNIEQAIARFWEMYQGNRVSPAKVIYPTTYSLKTDQRRLEESDKLQTLKVAVPSKTFQKEVSKRIVSTLLDGYVDYTIIDKINSEIHNANYVTSDPEDISLDLENGLVSSETASIARGYDGAIEVPIAQKEQAERLARIAISQTNGIAAARGIPVDPTDKSAKLEKDLAKNPDTL